MSTVGRTSILDKPANKDINGSFSEIETENEGGYEEENSDDGDEKGSGKKEKLKEGEGEETNTEQLKTTKRKRKTFTEQVLTGNDGLERIYENFPNKCQFRGRGSEEHDIRRMIKMLAFFSSLTLLYFIH